MSTLAAAAPSPPAPSPPGNVVIVHGLPMDLTPDALAADLTSRWGRLDWVTLSPDPALLHAEALGRLRPQWALVGFTDAGMAEAALASWSRGAEASLSYELMPYRAPDQQLPPIQTEAQLDDATALESELTTLRSRCGCLQAENQQLTGLVYEKDKATRLLLANVEAWKQKLDWVEKRKVEDVQRLQGSLTEKDRLVEHLAHGVTAMRAQLEERRAAEAANQAGMRRLQELERENIALLNILHGKCKDNPAVLQLLASLQTVKQDLRLHETENARLLCLLGQRDKQSCFLSARLDETRARVERAAWECGENGPQSAAARELVIERDRLRAQLAAISVGRDLQLTQPQPVTPQPEAAATVSAATQDENQDLTSIKDLNKDLSNKDFSQVSEADAAGVNWPIALAATPAAVVEEAAVFEDKENAAAVASPSAPATPVVAKIQPIGSGRLAKRKTAAAAADASTKPKTPVKSFYRGGGGDCENASGHGEVAVDNGSPASALTAAFTRLAVGSGRSPLGALATQ